MSYSIMCSWNVTYMRTCWRQENVWTDVTTLGWVWKQNSKNKLLFQCNFLLWFVFVLFRSTSVLLFLLTGDSCTGDIMFPGLCICLPHSHEHYISGTPGCNLFKFDRKTSTWTQGWTDNNLVVNSQGHCDITKHVFGQNSLKQQFSIQQNKKNKLKVKLNQFYWCITNLPQGAP